MTQNNQDNMDTGAYYDKLQIMYDIFYSRGTAGLHYGFWDKNTKTTKESIINTNKFVVKCLNINDNDIILDAGCGIGGTSIFIGKQSKAKVIGITLSKKQLIKAREKANKLQLKNVTFSQQDYTKTTFQDNSFSKIFGIESICYTKNNLDFLNEAYRLLKKGGRLVVSDAFLVRKNLNHNEKRILKKCLIGWGLHKFSNKEKFIEDLKKSGFKNIRYYDKFDAIKKTREKVYKLGLFAYIFTLLMYKFGIIPKCIHDNTVACINQKKLASDKNNVATYGVFVAEK